MHSGELQAEIEAVLQPLLGEPLTDLWRYAGFQRFEFGVQRPARKGAKGVTHSDWGFVVGCDWRISGPDGVIVSSADFTANGRTDQGAYSFYRLLEEQPPLLENLAVNAAGEIRFEFSSGYLLEVSPDPEASSDDPNGDDTSGKHEQWLFLPRDRRRTRVALDSDGLSRWR